MLTIVLLILILETKSIVDYFDLILLDKIAAKYFKVQTISSKSIRFKRSYSTLIKLSEVKNQN